MPNKTNYRNTSRENEKTRQKTNNQITKYLRNKNKKRKQLKKRMHLLQSDLYALDVNRFSDSLKEFINNIEKIPSNEYKEKVKQENTKAKRYFKYFSRVILLIIKSLLTRRKYFRDSWFKSIDYNPNLYLLENDKLRYSSILEAHETKSMLTRDTLIALKTPEEKRNDQILKKILTILSRNEVFSMIIPIDLTMEVAKRIKYEKLENGRIIAYEGQTAKNIYYVLSGKINCVKKFDLSDGELFKAVKILNKGEHTKPEEVEHKHKRNYLMYSKGVTEVLFLNFSDLNVLRKNFHELPIDSLQSINIFDSYPVKKLLKNSETILYKYYGPNEIVCHDSDNSPWIFVIISGYVKVVKKMKLFNSNRIKSAANFPVVYEKEPDQNVNSTTNSKDFKFETDRMMLDKFKISKNFQESTKEFKLKRESTLPPISFSNEKVTRQNSVYLSASIRRETPNFTLEKDSDYLENQFVKSEYDMERSLSSNKLFDTSNHPAQNSDQNESIKAIPNRRSAINPSPNYRLSYVVVDKIQKGSIFGLYPLIGEEKQKIENLSKKLAPKSADRRKNIILISEGAELLLINKVSFYHHADVLTLCKVQQLERADQKYVSEDEAREQLYKIEKWKEYKKKLLTSLVKLYK